MQAITTTEFKNISQLLHEKCGIHLNDDQDYLVETRLSHFAESMGLKSFSELFEKIKLAPDKFLPTIINLMTTNETLWFRDESCWNALQKSVIPKFIKSLGETQQDINIWVAGCSTGQEAYSLAILIDELCQQQKQSELTRRFHIQAMDISENALHIARVARYNDFEIKRGLSLARRNNYFECHEEGYWTLRPNIRLRVHFEPINLTHDFTHLGKFDLIFCRNVTIYFTPQMRGQILIKMLTLLKPQGALFLGSTESLRALEDKCSSIEFEGCVYLKNISR